jgi:hypothetical protein
MSTAPSAPVAHRARQLVVLVATGLGATVISWAIAQHSLIEGRWYIVWMIGAWAPLWLVGSRAATRLDRRTSLLVVAVLAILVRLAAASGTTPSISNDLYRYAWDAHVQLAGTDPYRYPPDARGVAHLRTPAFWPSPAGCAHIHKHPGCTILNRPGVRTIYPPAAEAWFVVVHVAAEVADPGYDGGGSRPWLLAAGAVDLVCAGLIARLLARRGGDPRAAAWYALCPAPVVEFAGNGHVDVVALALLLAATLALERGRRTLAGFVVGLAIMVKLYPAVALLAGWRRGRWRFVAAAVTTSVVAYVPHVLAVGVDVIGYLPGYLKQEHYESGGRFLIVGLLPVHGRLVTAAAVVVLAVACTLVLARGRDMATGTAVLMVALVLVTTPSQPWYAVVAAGTAVVVGRPWLLVVPLAVEVYYTDQILGDPHQVGVGRLCFLGAVGIGAVIEVLRRRRRSDDGRPADGQRVDAGGLGLVP